MPCDLYGFNNDKQQISKGFLTTECGVQFKFFDNPIIFWAPKLQSRIVGKLKCGKLRILNNNNNNYNFF